MAIWEGVRRTGDIFSHLSTIMIFIAMTMIISQDEHRFKGPVLASQRGFTVAREQDDVRGLQHRGGHGHHHTGAWSWSTCWCCCEDIDITIQLMLTRWSYQCHHGLIWQGNVCEQYHWNYNNFFNRCDHLDYHQGEPEGMGVKESCTDSIHSGDSGWKRNKVASTVSLSSS